MVIRVACQSLHDQVLTEYNTNNAKALQLMVEKHGVQLKRLPDDVIVAIGNAAGEVIKGLRDHSDDLVRAVTASYLEYRKLSHSYMAYADAAVFAARGLKYNYGE